MPRILSSETPYRAAAGGLHRSTGFSSPRSAVTILLKALVITLAALAIGLRGTSAATGEGLRFVVTAALTANAAELNGHVTLSLDAAEPLYNARVSARAQGEKALVGEVAYWGPGAERSFDLNIPSQHDLPGDYYLLVEVAFRDRNDAPLNAVVALGYSVAGPQGTGEAPENAGEVPAASLEADRILWQLPDTGVAQTRLTLTTEPAWALPSPLTPSTSRIVLLETGEQQALANWTYPQLARLDWVQNDRHFSRVSDWKLPTDAQGRWQYDVPQGPTVQWWNQRHWLWILAGLLAVGAIVRAHYASTTNRRPWLRLSGEEWMGGVALVAFTAWTHSHAVPSLWLTHTWSTWG